MGNAAFSRHECVPCGQPRFRSMRKRRARPANRAQKAPPIPAKLSPDPAIRNATNELMRLDGSAKRRGCGRAQGSKERQSGRGFKEARGAGGCQRRDGCRRQAQQDVEAARGNRGDPAPGAVLAGFFAGGKRRGDGREVDCMAAKESRYRGSDAGAEHRCTPRGFIVEARQHRHAGDVLRGHGHDKQRQGDSRECLDAERRGGEHEARHAVHPRRRIRWPVPW